MDFAPGQLHRDRVNRVVNIQNTNTIFYGSSTDCWFKANEITECNLKQYKFTRRYYTRQILRALSRYINNHYLAFYECSIKRLNTEAEINARMDKKNDVLLYLI